MRNKNRWLAAALAIAVALGDCGGMTAFATDNALSHSSADHNTVGESNPLPDTDTLSEAGETGGSWETDRSVNIDGGGETDSSVNIDGAGETDSSVNIDGAGETDSSVEIDGARETDSSVDVDGAGETEKTDRTEKLPALHIGQISGKESLPSADDDTFIYDRPVSFETGENLILFVNYDLETAHAYKDAGALEWSILRGEKGMEPGSASLLDEEDDWDGFEAAHSSPYFTMEEMTDAESEYAGMMVLVPEALSSVVKENPNDVSEAAAENYDYYIRAAYYPETSDGKSETFYSAATVPFLPQNDDGADTGQTSDGSADAEEAVTAPAQDGLSVSGNSTAPENSVDAADSDLSGNTLPKDDVFPADKNSSEESKQDTVSENTGQTRTEETFSTISENSSVTGISMPAGSTVLSLEPEKADVMSVTLNKKETFTMQPENETQITATVIAEPSGAAIPPLLWESSVESVATVTAGENGTATITALAEGYAIITASCGGKTASVTVDVVPDAADSGSKLLDLSNEIRVAGFERESDKLVYTGQQVRQNLRVYYKENLLTEKTDYTLTYRNNTNAARWNTVNAPSVTITLRGQYQGSVTLYYTIKPLDISQIDIYAADSAKTPAYEQTVNYGKRINIPAPVLNFGKKRLALKRDFVCDYAPLTRELDGADYTKGDSYEPGAVYHYAVRGTGNFTGSFQMELVILDNDLKKKNFSTALVKLDKARYDYCGTPLSKTDVKIETLRISNVTLDAGLYDYEVCASGIEGASLTVFPTDTGRDAGYRGCKKISLRLAGDRKINGAVFGANWKDEITFSQQTADKNGGIFQEKTDLLRFGSDTLVEGTDYTVKYGNAKNVGNVAVTFKGIGRYTGAVTKRYRITPNSDSRNLTIVWGDNVTENADGSLAIPYQKNGAAPEFYIRDENYTVLNSRTDYTVQLKDNRKPTAETQKDMTCTIRGKGNYKGYEQVVALTVTKADISKASLTVPDKQFNARPNTWKANVTVTDTNGKRLAARTDYIRDIEYHYDGMDPKNPNAVPPVGTTVTVRITGTGFYEGTLTGTYRIYDRMNDIGRLRIDIDPQTYTGGEIRLRKSDVHIYANAADQRAKKELAEKDACFEILESTYINNVRTGTARVTLHGTGSYGGTRTCSFRIQKKVYAVNRVKGIRLDKTSHKFSLASNEDQRKLTAILTPETTAQPLTNATVIWTSSNSKVATVEPVSADMGGSPQNGFASSAIIRAQSTGTVTITAATQDGNRKASCKLTIGVSFFTQAGQTISGKVGGTYQLTLDGNVNQEILADSVTFESDNPNAVSVSDRGLLTMKRVGAAAIKVYIGSKDNMSLCHVIVEGDTANPGNNPKALIYRQEPGCADDTEKINDLLWIWEHDPGKYDYMYLPDGVYHIDVTDGIVLRDNQTFIMSPGAQLVAIGNDRANSQIIWAFGRKNVVISGGRLVGERSSHTGSSGEWGHGINIAGCTNVHIQDVEISECWGDGIYLGLYDGWDLAGNRKRFYSSGITITSCNLHHNRRNNLSITDASNVTVENCEFNYANGTSPEYGIDIEPNNGYTCSNITISHSTFQGNAGGTIQILGQSNAHVKDVTLENCTGDKAPVIWQGFGGSVRGVAQKNNKWN